MLSFIVTVSLLTILHAVASSPVKHQHSGSNNDNKYHEKEALGGGTYWETLSSTFGGYYDLPLTLADAINDNWVNMMTCSDTTSPGLVYAQDSDLSTMPFYNADGYVSGVILGMIDPGDSSKVAPFKKYSLPNGTTFWGIEAHFRDPTTTCDSDNTANMNGTVGDRLWFTNDETYLEIPYYEDESTLTGAGWVDGACFVGMGEHYWRYISADMNCDDTYPIFLLYTRNKLNGWGIAMAHEDRPYLTSYRWEHPSGDILEYFFESDTFPTCLPDAGVLTTQHIFFQYAVWLNCIG